MNFLDNILDKQSHIIGHRNHIIQDIFKDHWDALHIGNLSIFFLLICFVKDL